MTHVPRKTALVLALACTLAGGCRKASTTDEAPHPRIASFSPAISGMLFAMGLGRHVVGVTTFCDVPEEFAGVPVVGDRARISAEAVLAVRPDLILVQQNPADFAAVTKIDPHVKVEHFKIETLDDIAAAIERVAALAGAAERGALAKHGFLAKLDAARERTAGQARPRTLFLMGFDSPSTGGKGTFLSEMISAAGGANAAAEEGYSGWRTLNRENVLAMAPDVLICQVPPGREEAAKEYWQMLADLPAVRAGRVFTVTDNRWTVPSIWSADFTVRLAAMIHPGGAPPAATQGGAGGQ
jgi:iron complex transport system substrate-binding protein